MLHAGKALVLSNLLLVPKAVSLAARASEVGLDGGDEAGQSLPAGQGLCHLLASHPLGPIIHPRIVVLAALQVDVEAPSDAHEPLSLQLVQLGDRNARHLGPRSVLEGVVVEKLAAEKQSDGQHPPDLSLDGMEGSEGLQAIDSLGEVVHAKQDGGLGQAGGRQDLRDEFSKRRRDWGTRRDQFDSHLGNVFGHGVDLIVEDSTNASARHIGGI